MFTLNYGTQCWLSYISKTDDRYTCFSSQEELGGLVFKIILLSLIRIDTYLMIIEYSCRMLSIAHLPSTTHVSICHGRSITYFLYVIKI